MEIIGQCENALMRKVTKNGPEIPVETMKHVGSVLKVCEKKHYGKNQSIV